MYGYITATRVKIILALTLTDAVVKDGDIIAVCIYFFSSPSRIAQDAYE